MPRVIPIEEACSCGRALAVRYRADPARPGSVLVSITAHDIDGDPSHVARGEFRLVAIEEPMSPDGMRARVEDEAGRRRIDRVAWIEEP